MSLIRAFVALEIPPDLQQSIARQSAALKKETPQAVRWVAAENIHLTFRFLGDTSASSLQELTRDLAAVVSQQPPFAVSVGGFGVFPNLKRPRVIWVGIQATPELERLQRAIESTCTRLGYPAEEKSFNPHLTLGRIREEADLSALRNALQNFQIGPLGSLTVSNLTLFRSDLRPQGPTYTALAHIQLGQSHS